MTLLTNPAPVEADIPASLQDAGLRARDTMSLSWALLTLSRQHGAPLDRLMVHEAVNALVRPNGHDTAPATLLAGVSDRLDLPSTAVLAEADPALMPALGWIDQSGWIIAQNINAAGQVIVHTYLGEAALVEPEMILPLYRLSFPKPAKQQNGGRPVVRLFAQQFLKHKRAFIEAAVATIIVNFLSMVISLYAMQVYDRVIPTQGYSTLFVLTCGVFLILAVDLTIKLARTHLMEGATIEIDRSLTRTVFGRLLNIRLDQFPGSVGSLSAQVRSYETVRGFLSSTTLYLLVDVPFAVVFLILIAIIASPLVALIPLVFIALATVLGLLLQHRSDELAARGAKFANEKTGLLVETIEGAATIKSGSGAFHFLSKWIELNTQAISQEATLRRMSELNAYYSGLLQQSCYVLIVCLSAYLAAESQFTQGAIMACAILSARAMGPISQLPVMIVQASHAKAAIGMLEGIYRLELDNHAVDRPVVPERLDGAYSLQNVRFAYPSSPQALIVPELQIQPGTKIGVIGPIGAGKSTLLKILSGMYLAGEGRVRLDNYDIEQISRHAMSEKLAYLQQDLRLFRGSLRENILVGLADPGDDMLKRAAAATGLLDVVSNHPRGLDLPIAEGGSGLSGGQKQLVGFTRLLLSRPEILLLDEPTASMDATTEERCISLLENYLEPQHTMVLVTHKLSLLPRLVDRVVIIVNHQIVYDAPRQQALDWLANLTPS